MIHPNFTPYYKNILKQRLALELYVFVHHFTEFRQQW
jgi:hypothetical protein